MKTQNFTQRIMWFVLSIMFATTINAQTKSEKLDPNQSTITILGTSNLHNWESKVTKINGVFAITSTKQVQPFVIKIPVKSIKSGKGMMDDLTYETFDEPKNPLITFQLTETATAVLTSENEGHVILTGNLSMAGVTKKISFKAVGKSTAKGVYRFLANVPLKMSDYNMHAPTAMFGAMKVGDGVTLKLDIVVLE